MRTTLSVIKADIGSVGGHTLPSQKVLEVVRERVFAERGRLLVDAYVAHTGDDVCLILSHRHGVGNPEVHALAWEAFRAGAEVAKGQGLYGAGQDLLKDAFSGNIRGLGPAAAEMEFEERPNEAVVVFAADKTEPGAFNLPLYLAFADPMYCSGLLLSPELQQGFRFRIMDVEYTEGDRVITLDAPERLYDIAALLRDTHRYVIESIWSRKYPNEQAAAVSTTRLRNIAGRYVGKDDPVALVRVQKIFPATEEFGPPFALAPFVAGDTRGSHNMPLMPVPINTPASTFFCVPMVSGLAFSVHEGKFTEPTDLFADPFWTRVREQAAAKALEMRRQGFFGPAMLPMSELEYTGIVMRLEALEKEFVVTREAEPAPAG
ncbi:MAG: fructose-1,6-bisphosphate aldolase/phosphatase [Armatimonadota bacterium]|nr:fructose-1,6-bisphosphatase [Armatimonadota bacterium]MDW8155252.1 fructose-1,6-bisphosphate aldolase/phosphatase [Armatimonadota bacterium]